MKLNSYLRLVTFIAAIILNIAVCSAFIPKKIMFIVHTESIGGKGVIDLYHEMKKEGHDVKIVAIPSYYKKELLNSIDLKFTNKFDQNDVVFPCGENPPYTKCESIEKYNADYVFIQNPYESYATSILDPYFLTSNLKKYAKKVMYIVYGPHLFHQDFANDKELKNIIDDIFVDSKSTKDIFIKRYEFPKDRVVVSGYQTYKSIRDEIAKPKAKTKETVLWLPRWSLSLKNRELYEGGSTFMNYYHFFYNYALENPQINFIIRPHNKLFYYAVAAKYLTQKELNDIFKKYRSLPNVVVSDHASRSLVDDVIASDVVISDGSSALGEVVVADKPIIYLSNGWNNEFNSNKLSEEFKNYIYFAYGPEEIIYYLDHIRKSDYSPFVENTWEGMRSKVAYYKRRLLNQTCSREEFKKLLDPVENPAAFISKYVSDDYV